MMNEALLVITTLLLAAFFAAMEIAFFASNKLRLQLDRKQGLFSSHIIGIFQARSGQYIATIQLGNNIAIVIYGIFMARWLEPVLGNFLSYRIQHTGRSNPHYNTDRTYMLRNFFRKPWSELIQTWPCGSCHFPCSLFL